MTVGQVNWLKIDLIHIFQRGEIKILNCLTNSWRLNGYKLEIGVDRVVYKQIAILRGDLEQTFQSGEISQYIQITKIAEDDRFLHVREVEVWV